MAEDGAPAEYKKYSEYELNVDPDQDDKATEIKLTSFSRPHMRAFHFSWSGFFIAFFIWFAIAPLLSEIRDDLDLTKGEVWTSSIVGVGGTIFMRFVLGPWLAQQLGILTMRASLLYALIWSQYSRVTCLLSSPKVRRAGDFVDVHRDGDFAVVHRPLMTRQLDATNDRTSIEIAFASCPNILVPNESISQDLVLYYDYHIAREKIPSSSTANETTNMTRAIAEIEALVHSQMMDQLCNDQKKETSISERRIHWNWMLPLLSYSARPRDTLGIFDCESNELHCSAGVSGALTVRVPKAIQVTNNLTCSVIQLIHEILLDPKTVTATESIDWIYATKSHDLPCASAAIQYEANANLQPIVVILFAAAAIAILFGTVSLTRACCYPHKYSTRLEGTTNHDDNATASPSTSDEESGVEPNQSHASYWDEALPADHSTNDRPAKRQRSDSLVLDSIPEAEEMSVE